MVVKFAMMFTMNSQFPRFDRIPQPRLSTDDSFQRLGRQRNVRFATLPGVEAKLSENPFAFAGVVAPRQERVARVTGRMIALQQTRQEGVISGDLYETRGGDGAFAGDLYSPLERLEQAREQAEVTHRNTIDGKIARLAVLQAFDEAWPILAATDTVEQGRHAIPPEATRDWFEPAA